MEVVLQASTNSLSWRLIVRMLPGRKLVRKTNRDEVDFCPFRGPDAPWRATLIYHAGRRRSEEDHAALGTWGGALKLPGNAIGRTGERFKKCDFRIRNCDVITDIWRQNQFINNVFELAG